MISANPKALPTASSAVFLENLKEKHRRERRNSKLSLLQKEGENVGRSRGSSFSILADRATAKKRTENKYNSMFVNDEHLVQDGVHIPKIQLCCGKPNAHGRTHLFHILESPSMRMAVIVLLAIDVFCVFMEIMFYDRVIPPSFDTETQPGTLYVPSNYVCANSDKVTSTKKLKTCCNEYQLNLGSASQFATVDACYDAHYNRTVLTGIIFTHHHHQHPVVVIIRGDSCCPVRLMVLLCHIATDHRHHLNHTGHIILLKLSCII